jgi:hypothetical protein
MRYVRPFAVVTVEKVSDDVYLVTDGDREYYIDQKTLERDFQELL